MRGEAKCRCRWPWTVALALVVGVLAAAGPALAQVPCTVPDNGGGTVYLPPANCPYVSPSDFHMIVNGLPPGTTIEVGVEHERFVNVTRTPGGPLGGEVETFNSQLTMHLDGTGGLDGYSRSVAMMNVQSTTAVGPRNPGDPIQSFDTEMLNLQGQLPPGDPDFDLLRITAGPPHTLPPSPGHTTLTQQPGGTWAVDSFFDITYRIEFIGKPGGPLGGMSGSTTGTIRMGAGLPACGTQPLPTCNGTCPPGTVCQPNPATGHCNCVPVQTCQSSPWPACNGICPNGLTCDPDPTGIDLCVCQSAPTPCASSPFPDCLGTCPQGTHCEPNTTGVAGCECVPDQVPCSQSPVPDCLGTCPAGQVCEPNAVGCGCINEPTPCANSPFPDCLGTCPQGTHCEPNTTGVPGCECVPDQVPCSQSPVPDCLGTCPAGQVCEPNAVGCGCINEPTPCASSPFPDCLGTCPQGTHCEPSTVAPAHCECVPDVVPCPQSPFPDCLGTCPSGQLCEPNTAGVCECAPIPCEDTEPACDGPCPPGLDCLTDAVGNCFCNPTPDCDETFFPNCSGVCPPGQNCVNVPGTNNCDCFTPPPVCEQSPFPGCAGTCPVGQECQPMADGTCHCISPVPCDQTFHPNCSGTCPPNQECVNIAGTSNCQCRPLPPPVCSLAPFPACNGSCPAFQRCVKVSPGVDPPCRCEWCIIVVPGPDIVIDWVSKTRIRWTVSPCAGWHNVYRATLARLSDLNQDGVADNYGTCVSSDEPDLEWDDLSTPPPGMMHIYLVTGENDNGEGSMGHTSAGLERPNVTPCP